MDYLQLVNEKLNVESLTELVTSPKCGAVSVFIGTTRDYFEDKKVVRLDYEAYQPMAIKSLKSVCQDIRQKYNVEHILIYHRLGEVPVKEASVVIAISSPHRKDSLEAVSYAIDTLKANVPIWKKEIYDGAAEPEWKANTEYPAKSVSSNQTPETSDDKDSNEVPQCMIQIKADNAEIKRRIQSFINLKRSQANETNIQQFCMLNSGNIDSCARVSAVYTKRKEVDRHVKVHRVYNEVGPQTHGSDENIVPGVLVKPKAGSLLGSEERISNIETHLKLDVVSDKDVFKRLKAVEDRLLYLEGLSPEYFQSINSTYNQGPAKYTTKRPISHEDLNNKVKELEKKLFRSPTKIKRS